MSNEIEPNNLVLNIDIYESDETDEDIDLEMPDLEKRSRLKSVDEETENNCDILNSLLEDIGKVDPLGKKYLFLEFHDPKNITFHKKDEDCDFDTNESGYPYLPEGSEEFILPFFKKLVKLLPSLKNITIETNSKSFTFKS